MNPRKRKNTAAWRLFHFTYPIYLAPMHLVSPEYLNKVGYHISGDPKVDQDRMQLPTVHYKSPAGMAMLKEDGAPIDASMFVKVNDVVDTYHDIQEHLHNWKQQINQGLHVNLLPPLEEFRQFEALALDLHEMAKLYEPHEFHRDPLKDKLMSMRRARSELVASVTVKQRVTEKRNEVPPYVSVVDEIERLIFKEQRVWL